MSKSEQAPAKPEDHDGHTVDLGAAPDVVKVQPDAGHPVGLPVLDVPTPAGDQPPAGPGGDLFSTWNDPAPLDVAEEAADDDA